MYTSKQHQEFTNESRLENTERLVNLGYSIHEISKLQGRTKQSVAAYIHYHLFYTNPHTKMIKKYKNKGFTYDKIMNTVNSSRSRLQASKKLNISYNSLCKLILAYKWAEEQKNE